MSNLSDLLPAGASAKQITATDSGSGIASKKPVILNSDGTVTEVSSSTVTANVGAVALQDYGAATWCATAAGSGSTNLVAYPDVLNSSYGTAQVGTISGTNVTFGTQAVFESASVTGIQMAYSSSLDKYLIVYRDNGNSYYGTCVVATVSGTSVTFGTPVAFSARTTNGYGVVYDDTASAFVVQYTNNATVYVRACSVSGTVPTFGGEVTVESSTSYNNSAIGYDSVAGKPVGAWRNYTSQQAKAVVYSLSGTTVTANTPVVFASGNGLTGADCKISYNVKENRIVIGYKEGAGTSGTAIAGEVSGTSITFGTAVQFNASSSGSITCDYDATVARTIIGYLDAGAASYPKAIPVTLSGSTITFPDSATTLQSAAASNMSASYNATEGKMLFSWIDSSPTQGESVVFTSPGTVENLTATNFVGVADSAISASAAGSIIVQGGTVSGVSPELATGSTTDLTGKTQSPYPVLTYDTTNSKFVAFFEDGNNSNYGTAVVITVSGSTVSFGTPVVFSSANTLTLDAVYNAAADQHMVVYPDYGNSQQATAVVGSVSGTSITFGTPAIYDTGTANVNASVGYNATLGKYLAAATPTSYAADDLKVYVLSVSGTTITAGSGVTVGSGKRYPNIVANDSASDFVLTNNTGNNQAEAHLISVSGTTPTIEDTEAITSVVSSSFPYTGLAFLESNKFVCVTNDATNDNMYTRTITVSGTSLSIGTQSSAFTVDRDSQTTINGAWPLFFVSATEAYLYYQDDTSNYLKYVPITISGTTATGGAEVTYYSTAVAYAGFLYNSSAKQSVSFFQESSQTKGLAQNGALTVGTKYYVTTSGTFSSSADTPSVNAGLAISTTSLLLNGDS